MAGEFRGKRDTRRPYSLEVCTKYRAVNLGTARGAKRGSQVYPALQYFLLDSVAHCGNAPRLSAYVG